MILIHSRHDMEDKYSRDRQSRLVFPSARVEDVEYTESVEAATIYSGRLRILHKHREPGSLLQSQRVSNDRTNPEKTEGSQMTESEILTSESRLME